MKEKTKKVSEPGSFKVWKVPAWASRAAALTVNIAVLLQVTYYCTDALGMAPGLVGILLLVSKLFDGFTDLAAGFIIDKIHSKWGKARPYEFCILLAWIFTVFMFSTPANFSMTGKCIWVFVTYTMICSVFQTFLNSYRYLLMEDMLFVTAEGLCRKQGDMAEIVAGYLAGFYKRELNVKNDANLAPVKA